VAAVQSRLGIAPSVRGAGVFFGPDITKKFCDANGVELVVRSHECVPDGYECVVAPLRGVWLFAMLTLVARLAHWDFLVTIFSASHYQQGGDNIGAILVLNKALKREFIQFEVSS